MRHTLYDKIWRDHVIEEAPDGTCLLYVDRHLVHSGLVKAQAEPQPRSPAGSSMCANRAECSDGAA